MLNKKVANKWMKDVMSTWNKYREKDMAMYPAQDPRSPGNSLTGSPALTALHNQQGIISSAMAREAAMRGTLSSSQMDATVYGNATVGHYPRGGNSVKQKGLVNTTVKTIANGYIVMSYPELQGSYPTSETYCVDLDAVGECVKSLCIQDMLTK